MSRKIHATEFRSPLTPTHKIVNTKTNKILLEGALSECLAFFSGLEYGDNDSGSSLWYDTIMIELKEKE